MENETINQPEIQPPVQPQSLTTKLTQDQMLAEILDNSRKTKSYMKWQLIITVALVVLPLLAMIFIIPFALRSLTSIYSIGAGAESTLDAGNLQDLIQQYQK